MLREEAGGEEFSPVPIVFSAARPRRSAGFPRLTGVSAAMFDEMPGGPWDKAQARKKPKGGELAGEEKEYNGGAQPAPRPGRA